MGRKHIRDLNPNHDQVVVVGNKDRYIEYKNLFLNNVAILIKSKNEPLDYPTEAFIKNNLFEDGKIGYLKDEQLPCKIAKLDNYNKLGNPTKANFTYGNGKQEEVKLSYDKDGNNYVIDAFIDTYALSTIVKDAISEMDLYHSAKIQNINACKTPYIIQCKNKNVQLSIENAIKDQQDGKPVIVVDSSIGDGLVSIKTNVEFIADKYDELEDKAKDKLLNKLGIMSANINKKERVQVGEVNATLGQCLDYIYALIDNFNKQCDTYGIDLIMVDNTSLNEYTETDEDKPNNETNKGDK